MNAPATTTDERWRAARVAEDGTHHCLEDGQPLYEARFDRVLKYHAPGRAPVTDEEGAYHIHADGRPAYPERYRRTFGFYEERAAVDAGGDGWFHVLPDGSRLYQASYDWCGNYQGELCAVRRDDGRYLHLTLDGSPAYAATWAYTGDFRSGIAAVQRDDGLHTHIDRDGELLHDRWFRDLDVFHKGFARACDADGWHHIDRDGRPIYQRRFADVEPFYNGQARVKRPDGALEVIDENGRPIRQLREPPSASRSSPSPLQALSGDMVGFWKTQTIAAAVELGIFEALPAQVDTLEEALELPARTTRRLMRALWELELVEPKRREASELLWLATARGELLSRESTFNMGEATKVWAGEHYRQWQQLPERLKEKGTVVDEASHFRSMAEEELAIYQRAISGYARHDYSQLPTLLDWSRHDHIVDVGGGRGDLLFGLLSEYHHTSATLLELPDVVELVEPPAILEPRFSAIGHDFFEPWPVAGDGVVLARVLHDWNDTDALQILSRARENMKGAQTRLYIVELLLDDLSDEDATPNGGLLDLNMLTMTGGRERTLDDFRELLQRAGLQLHTVYRLPSVSTVLEAAPAASSTERVP